MDENYKPLTFKQALAVVKKCDVDILYKPVTDSEQGFGIEKYSTDKLGKLYDDLNQGRLFERGTDFVLLELVEQSEDTKFFNPTSLNCFRVTTLNLNDRVSICSMALKCGPKNSVVDNIGRGKRGVIIGLNAIGELNPSGFYGNGERTKSHNDVIFDGIIIKNFPKIVDAAINLHEYA